MQGGRVKERYLGVFRLDQHRDLGAAQDDPFCALDLDHCGNGDGTPAPRAEVLIHGLATFTEVTPCGNGFRPWAVGKKPGPRSGYKNKAAGIEIFELLTAVGIKETHADSRFKAFRVLGKKHRTVLEVGFEKLAVFKPGTIVGNAHTPRWITHVTGLIPDSLGWGNIRQDEVARAFVAHLEKRAAKQHEPVVSYGNKEMKRLIRE